MPMANETSAPSQAAARATQAFKKYGKPVPDLTENVKSVEQAVRDGGPMPRHIHGHEDVFRLMADMLAFAAHSCSNISILSTHFLAPQVQPAYAAATGSTFVSQLRRALRRGCKVRVLFWSNVPVPLPESFLALLSEFKLRRSSGLDARFSGVSEGSDDIAPFLIVHDEGEAAVKTLLCESRNRERNAGKTLPSVYGEGSPAAKMAAPHLEGFSRFFAGRPAVVYDGGEYAIPESSF